VISRPAGRFGIYLVAGAGRRHATRLAASAGRKRGLGRFRSCYGFRRVAI
jgi:hypothetical protein